MKIAFVVQRYGTEILGGSEYHCRLIAERLAPRHQVEVLTTCAQDYITWKNEYSEGSDRVRGVTVRRFANSRTRDIHTFNRYSEWIFTSPHCSYFRAIQSFSVEQGLQLTQRFRVNEDLTVLNLVAEGMGLTLTARSQIEVNGFEGRIVTLPHFRATVPLNIACLAANLTDPAIQAVREQVLQVWAAPDRAGTPSAAAPVSASRRPSPRNRSPRL